MVRVAIVDDHPLARRGIEQILAASGRLHVVAAVSSPEGLAAAVAAAGKDEPLDVVVLDLYYNSDRPSLSAVAELAATTRVLITSASSDRDDVLGAIRVGAAGYVTKSASPELLVAAVETVAAGGFALSSQLADMVHAELGRDALRGGPWPALSAREDEALSLIASGLTHAQAAARMGVSKATVDTYVERIRVKLQVGNKAELTRLARCTTALSAPRRVITRRDEGRSAYQDK